jgi:hypothetical protein
MKRTRPRKMLVDGEDHEAEPPDGLVHPGRCPRNGRCAQRQAMTPARTHSRPSRPEMGRPGGKGEQAEGGDEQPGAGLDEREAEAPSADHNGVLADHNGDGHRSASNSTPNPMAIGRTSFAHGRGDHRQESRCRARTPAAPTARALSVVAPFEARRPMPAPATGISHRPPGQGPLGPLSAAVRPVPWKASPRAAFIHLGGGFLDPLVKSPALKRGVTTRSGSASCGRP